ncbi:MAG: helix-turn-helix domain-containing protein [Solirubrobacterales bacterium]
MPARAPDRKLFDSDAFYAALDGARRDRDLRWKDVAAEAEISASTLTRMAQGRRPDVNSLAALCQWADLDANDYMRRSETLEGDSPKDEKNSDFLAMTSTYLRSDRNLTTEGAKALDTMIKTAYEQFRKPK